MAGRGGSLNAVSLTARALELAYRYLGRRERTVSEVRAYLIGRGIDEAAAEAAIRELTDEGYLDDVRFARLFVQDKRELEQWGSERISRGLEARGIDRELAAAALGVGASATDADERDRALDLLRRRFPDPPRDRRLRERALGLLLRRGYPYEVAAEALSAHSDRAT